MSEPHPFDCLPAHIRRDVEAHIERCRELREEDVNVLATVWDGSWDGTWEAAWDAMVDASRADAMNAAVDDTMEAIMDGSTAMDVAVDAVRALITRDLISEEHFNTFYGPWASAMGPLSPDCSPERVRHLEARIVRLESACRNLLQEYYRMEEVANSA